MVLSQLWYFFEVEETLCDESLLSIFTSCFLQAPGGRVLEIKEICHITLVIVLEVMAIVDHGIWGFLLIYIVAVIVEVMNLSLAPEVMDRVRLVRCLWSFLI